MSEHDRDKWNSRYREGAYSDRRHASELLVAHAPGIIAARCEGEPRPCALDLACGAGRNARYLADIGFRVDAVDISTEALTRGKADSREQQLPITWIELDLDRGLPADLPRYDLAVIIRYLDLALVQAAAERLHPGGHLICEVHLQSNEPVAGPRGTSFRTPPGALYTAAQGLEVIHYWEGLTRDPDDRPVALAQLVARRSSAKT